MEPHANAATPGQRFRAWWRDGDNVLFAALLVLHLAPIWAFTYFPSQDGPAHLNSANIVRLYHRLEGAALREYFTLNTRPEPNWAGYLALAGLMDVVPPLTAEKILLTACVTLLMLSIRYALRAVRPGAAWLGVLGFPLATSYLLHVGFYNFACSLPVFFWTVGFWLRRRERAGWGAVLGLMLLSVALFFCHIVSVLAAALALGIATAWRVALDARRGALWRGLRDRALPVAVALLPAAVLAVVFFMRQGVGNVWHWSPWLLAAKLATLYWLVSFQPAEAVFMVVLVTVFAVVVVRNVRAKQKSGEWCADDGWLAVAVVCFVLYFLMPEEVAGGGVVTARLALFAFFALLVWFGTLTFSAAMRRAVRAIGALVAVALVGMHTLTFARTNALLADYCSVASHVESGRTLLALSFDHQGHTPDGRLVSHRVKPFSHASGYIAVLAGAVDLTNYEGRASYFPIAYRPALNPYVHIGNEKDIESQTPRADFLSYPQRTGGRVDYVLLWGVARADRAHPGVQSIFSQLAAGYELAFTSPQGNAQLYHCKPGPP